MTKDEAKTSQKWAGMDGTTAWHLIDRHADNWSEIGLMMTAWLEENQKPNSIAQAIRDAAVNWPPFVGDVECGVLDAFIGRYEQAEWRPSRLIFDRSVTHARTFMLLVAEALES